MLRTEDVPAFYTTATYIQALTVSGSGLFLVWGSDRGWADTGAVTGAGA